MFGIAHYHSAAVAHARWHYQSPDMGNDCTLLHVDALRP